MAPGVRYVSLFRKKRLFFYVVSLDGKVNSDGSHTFLRKLNITKSPHSCPLGCFGLQKTPDSNQLKRLKQKELMISHHKKGAG